MTTTAPRIRAEWAELLADAFAHPGMTQLSAFLRERMAAGATIHPPMKDVFAAFEAAPPHDVKVVWLGQDPYHRAGQANGYSFSVHRDMKIPPSLENMFKEREADLGIAPSQHGDLASWARQGVLLLNTLLTVEEGRPLAHKGWWERFTDAVIRAMSDEPAPKVFMLLGAHAQKKAKLVDEARHFVIRAPHPSPLSAHTGFFGSKIYSRANAFLEAGGRGAIDWRT